jgi:ornithine cyclodeaminase/alanine dehydrogenase-like protein (mu-crystallin family)
MQFPIIDGIRRQIKIAAAPDNKYLALIYLFSSETGEMLGIFQDAFLQKLRVGATSAIGAKYLSRRDSGVLGLFGSGWQAGAHVAGISKVRNIEKVKVFSPNREHRHAFADEMGEILNIDMIAVDSPKAVVKESDIIITATNAIEPVFNGEWLQQGVHIGSISSHGIELDPETYRRSDIIIINSKQFVKEMKQMELLALIEAGIIGWDHIHELGKLVNGEAPTRENNRQISLFKNNCGLGIQFSAVGAKILEEAKKKGLGREIPSEWFLQTRKGAATY